MSLTSLLTHYLSFTLSRLSHNQQNSTYCRLKFDLQAWCMVANSSHLLRHATNERNIQLLPIAICWRICLFLSFPFPFPIRYPGMANLHITKAFPADQRANRTPKRPRPAHASYVARLMAILSRIRDDIYVRQRVVRPLRQMMVNLAPGVLLLCILVFEINRTLANGRGSHSHSLASHRIRKRIRNEANWFFLSLNLDFGSKDQLVVVVVCILLLLASL